MNVCSVENCWNHVMAAGFCSKHYQKNLKYGDPLAGITYHPTGQICSADGCHEKAKSLGFCIKHYTRMRKYGNTETVLKGERGKGYTRKDGYLILSGGSRASQKMLAHVHAAEKAVGGPLPKGAVVHHVDGNPSNNANSNLVVCPDQAYHLILHVRTRALMETGNANLLRCEYCKRYDSRDNLWVSKTSYSRAHHSHCNAAQQRKRKQRIAQENRT
jgi:hypothetical protein